MPSHLGATSTLLIKCPLVANPAIPTAKVRHETAAIKWLSRNPIAMTKMAGTNDSAIKINCVFYMR